MFGLGILTARSNSAVEERVRTEFRQLCVRHYGSLIGAWKAMNLEGWDRSLKKAWTSPPNPNGV